MPNPMKTKPSPATFLRSRGWVTVKVNDEPIRWVKYGPTFAHEAEEMDDTWKSDVDDYYEKYGSPEEE